ncbi:MAG TPA: PDGLE domain-containing protein [archaeon]|nr:PDGLE domain-containing protein [archaeon]
MSEYRKFWVALIVMALVSPIGLYLPWIMQAGSAWGEWGLEEIKQMVGYTPAGIEKHAEIWKAPISEYGLPRQEQASLSQVSLSYILSALVGTAGCGLGGYLLTRWATGSRRKRRE